MYANTGALNNIVKRNQLPHEAPVLCADVATVSTGLNDGRNRHLWNEICREKINDSTNHSNRTHGLSSLEWTSMCSFQWWNSPLFVRWEKSSFQYEIFDSFMKFFYFVNEWSDFDSWIILIRMEWQHFPLVVMEQFECGMLVNLSHQYRCVIGSLSLIKCYFIALLLNPPND
jgi:hypothetical protein